MKFFQDEDELKRVLKRANSLSDMMKVWGAVGLQEAGLDEFRDQISEIYDRAIELMVQPGISESDKTGFQQLALHVVTTVLLNEKLGEVGVDITTDVANPTKFANAMRTVIE